MESKPPLTSEQLYWLYPRHLEKRDAIRAINNAIGRLVAGESGNLLSQSEARIFLESKVVRFKNSPAGNRGTLTKYPATWFNKSCYLDDEHEWYRGEENAPSKNEQRIAKNRAAILQGLGYGPDAGSSEPDLQNGIFNGRAKSLAAGNGE